MTIGIVGDYIFNNIFVNDTILDGQLFDNSADVTLTVPSLGSTLLNPSFIEIIENKGNDCCADSTTGETLLKFSVSDAMLASFGRSTVTNVDDGMSITYGTVVQAAYTDSEFSGSQILAPGNCLDNFAELRVDLVDSDNALLGVEQRSAQERISLPIGQFSSQLIAVDGVLCADVPAICNVSPDHFLQIRRNVKKFFWLPLCAQMSCCILHVGG